MGDPSLREVRRKHLCTVGDQGEPGDYVRLVRVYIDIFGLAHAVVAQEDSNIREDERIKRLYTDLKVILANFFIVRLTLHCIGIPRSARALERER